MLEEEKNATLDDKFVETSSEATPNNLSSNQKETRTIKIIFISKHQPHQEFIIHNLPKDITAADLMQIVVDNCNIWPPFFLFEDDMMLADSDFVHEDVLKIRKRYNGIPLFFKIFLIYHAITALFYFYTRSFNNSMLLYSILSLCNAVIIRLISPVDSSYAMMTVNIFYRFFRFIWVYFTSMDPFCYENFDFMFS